MDDLTQRLRNAPNWMREGFGKSWKDTGLTFDRAPFEAADEIDRLRAELVRTNERWEKSHQTALAIQDERDALRAEVEGLRADAERYRWLTDDHQSWDTRNEVARIAQDITIHGKGYTDAAIDAAIAARKP